MRLFYSVFYYIYKNILGQKDFPDEEYVSALKTVLHPNYTKWLNAEGIDKDKKKECLEDLKHFLESIEVLKSYKLLNETLEDHRKYTLNNIEKQMLFLSTLIDLLEHRPAEYDIAVSYAKKYMYDQQESQKSLKKMTKRIKAHMMNTLMMNMINRITSNIMKITQIKSS